MSRTVRPIILPFHSVGGKCRYELCKLIILTGNKQFCVTKWHYVMIFKLLLGTRKIIVPLICAKVGND